MKKIILSFGIVFLSACPAFANNFIDVDNNNPYKESIEELYNLKVVNGYSDKTFKPNSGINRAEFLKILLETKGIEPQGDQCFSDVNGQWFSGYICAAYDLQFVSGYPDGTFKPDKNISFAEASVLLVKLFRIKPATLASDNIEWFEPYISALKSINSVPPEITSANQNITRGQFAHLIVRVKKHGPDLEEVKTGNSDVVYFLKDKHNVYDASSLAIIDWIDPETFSIFEFDFYPFGDTILYGRNLDKFWYVILGKGNVIVNDEIDADSFEVVSRIVLSQYADEHIVKKGYTWSGKDICESIQATFKPATAKQNGDPSFVKEYLAIGPDGTCSVIQEYKQEAGIYDRSGLLLKDNRNIYKISEDTKEISKIAYIKLDAKSFEKIADYQLFKDKNGVYYFKEDKLTIISNVDPSTVEVVENDSTDKLDFIIDKYNKWNYDSKLNEFRLAE